MITSSDQGPVAQDLTLAGIASSQGRNNAIARYAGQRSMNQRGAEARTVRGIQLVVAVVADQRHQPTKPGGLVR